MRALVRVTFILALLLALTPAALYAQAAIAGVVKDTSGAVLPGVTVEASSPALIEKTRSVVTDGTGQYKIVDLRPGTYAVTFSLAGFNTVTREGIELTGSFTAAVNAELRVGALEETVTVTGETPIVDVQSATSQRVFDKRVIDAVPTSDTHFSVATLIPAIQSSNTQDVGGTNALQLVNLTAHGGRNTDQRQLLDGLSIANTEGAGQASQFVPNMASVQEVSVDIAAGTAQHATGGVTMNMIPREGGNTVRGTFFATGANEDMTADNLTADLIARGLTTPTRLKTIWDVNGGVGGPIKQDRLWFYAAAMRQQQAIYSGGYTNLNAGNPSLWTYAQGTPSTNNSVQRSVNGRLTWQASEKNKVSYYYDNQYRCLCPRNLTPLLTPEATTSNWAPLSNITSVTWSSPRTSRLLLESGFLFHNEEWGYPRHDLNMIPVTEQGGALPGLTYRGQLQANSGGQFPYAIEHAYNIRAAASYVTGSHAFKVGFANQSGTRDIAATGNDYNLAYRFRDGVPNQLTQFSAPIALNERIKADLGIYAQDKWTIRRLTVSLGVRFDYFNIYFPPQALGPSLYTPNRNVSFPETPWVAWKDLTPRLAGVYDVFGNGRTAVRVSLNKYMQAFGLQGMFGDGSAPINLTTNTVTRAWNDLDRDYVPDCDLVATTANGECGPMSSANFGQVLPSATVDPDILRGWGKRGYNWEFTTGIQHALFPRVSVDAAFFRRSYGNFAAIQNLATPASAFSPFSVTAPVDSRLPGGGGYTINGFYDLNPAYVGQVNHYYTFASNLGDMSEHWVGGDFGFTARLREGAFFQGGVSTGKTVSDNCAVLAQAPNALTGTAATGVQASVTLANTPVGVPYCHSDTGLRTQLRVSGSYVIPTVDVQASFNFQTLPGAALRANYIATNAVVAPSLSRNLSANAANVTVNLLAPGEMFGDRVNQLDLRLGKLLNFGRFRATASVDVFNVFNINPVLTENANYAAWRTPQSILQSRFAKLGLRVDF